MAITYFTESLQSNITKGEMVYEGFISSNAIGDSDIVMFPEQAGKINYISAVVNATGGEGTLMWTLSSRQRVQNGMAQWYAWDQGVCNGVAKSDVLVPVTAIMIRNVNGYVELEVVAQ